MNDDTTYVVVDLMEVPILQISMPMRLMSLSTGYVEILDFNRYLEKHLRELTQIEPKLFYGDCLRSRVKLAAAWRKKNKTLNNYYEMKNYHGAISNICYNKKNLDSEFSKLWHKYIVAILEYRVNMTKYICELCE